MSGASSVPSDEVSLGGNPLGGISLGGIPPGGTGLGGASQSSPQPKSCPPVGDVGLHWSLYD
jgi:hypothetical protein